MICTIHYVILPRSIRFLQRAQIFLACKNLFIQFVELSPIFAFLSVVEPNIYLSIANIKMKTHKRNPILKRHDLAFRIQFQAQSFQILLDAIFTVLQIFLAFVNQTEIICISSVISYAEFTGNKLVQTIQIQIRY